MNCQNHPGVEASFKCIACGASICENCRVIARNEALCKSCAASKLEGRKRMERSPGLAAFLSVIIGGAGQIYNGQTGKGIFVFLTTWLVIPWIYGIFDAYNTAKKINEGAITPSGKTGCGTAAIVLVVVLVIVVPLIGLLAAIAIPNFIKARGNAMRARGMRAPVKLAPPSEASAKSTPPKTVSAGGVQNILSGMNRQMYKVYLKNGHRFEASIDSETEDVYIFKIGNGTFQVNKGAVDRMKKLE